MSQTHSSQSTPSSSGSSTNVEDQLSSGYHSSPESNSVGTIANSNRNTRRRRWHRYTCMNTPLEKSGLLYCATTQTDGLLSVVDENDDVNDVDSELMSVLSQAPVMVNAIASSIILDRALHFGGKLNQIEETEETFVAQLEYLRDYYMRPLLGHQTTRTPPRSRGLSLPLLSNIFNRKRSGKNLAKEYRDGETSNNTNGSAGSYRNRSGSVPSLPRNLPSSAALESEENDTGDYTPSAEAANILTAPFGSLFRMIEQHTLFLVALKRARPLDSQPHLLVDLFSDHISRLSLYYTHIKDHPKALSDFETLVFNDERLARAIEERDKTAKHGPLRALLVTIPVSRIWYYGAVLQSMRQRFSESRTDPAVRKLRVCLQMLEELVRRLWPILKQIGKIQRVAVLQSNISNVKKSILTPNQRIFLMDMVRLKRNDVGATWSKVCAVLLRDRLLVLKEKSGQTKRFLLKNVIYLNNASFTAFKRLQGEDVEGIYIREPHSVDTKLNFLSFSSFSTWQRYLNAHISQNGLPYNGSMSNSLNYVGEDVTFQRHVDDSMMFTRAGDFGLIGNIFGLETENSSSRGRSNV